MDRCIIFLSKYEDYLKSAKKIKDNSNLKVNINYVEDFILKENKIEILKNSIIYFLCNSELNKKLVELLRNTNCYIFNKKFFESNYTKLEMQELLIKTDLLKYIDVAYEMLNSTGITGVIEELEDYVRLRGCKIVEVNETR